MDRLFLPLNRIWYNLFVRNEKTWELRGLGNQFNENTVRLGRDVELRLGYRKGASRWGKIDSYIIAHSWEELPKEVQDGVLPLVVHDDPAVMRFFSSYLEKYSKTGLIAFKIVLSGD